MQQQNNVVFVGDGGVGKTSIANRLTGYGGFSETYAPTSGFKFLEGGIIDSSGQEKLGTDWSTLRDIGRVAIVFDLTNRLSFKNLRFWIELAHREFPLAQISLIGNKSDCQRKVNPQDIETLCNRHRIQCIEVSARTAANIDQILAPS